MERGTTEGRGSRPREKERKGFRQEWQPSEGGFYSVLEEDQVSVVGEGEVEEGEG